MILKFTLNEEKKRNINGKIVCFTSYTQPYRHVHDCRQVRVVTRPRRIALRISAIVICFYFIADKRLY